MDKKQMIKELIRFEIQQHGPLVKNACDNELQAFKLYLIERKEQLNQTPSQFLVQIWENQSKLYKKAG